VLTGCWSSDAAASNEFSAPTPAITTRRVTGEMSAAMPILAIALLAFGWHAILPKSDLALLEHGLMMPVMLIPMFIRLDLYTDRTGQMTHTAHAVGR
jgi:hypothetical protein